MKNIIALFAFIVVSLVLGGSNSMAASFVPEYPLKFTTPKDFSWMVPADNATIVRNSDEARISIIPVEDMTRDRLIIGLLGGLAKQNDSCVSISGGNREVPETDAAYRILKCGDGLRYMAFWLMIEQKTYGIIMAWPKFDIYDEQLGVTLVRDLRPNPKFGQPTSDDE